MIAYCPDRHKTQKMREKAVDDCLAGLKFIPYWFVTIKMLEKLDNVVHANYDIFFFNGDFDKVTFMANQGNIFAADLDKINLDNDNKFDEDDSDTIIHARLLAWRSIFEKRKKLKKN